MRKGRRVNEGWEEGGSEGKEVVGGDRGREGLVRKGDSR